MKKLTTFIYYQIGAYGTFIEWCLNYFTDLSFNQELVINDSGNSHNYPGYPLVFPPQFENYIKSPMTVNFARLHPGSTSISNSKILSLPKSFTQLINAELDILSNVSDHTIVPYYSTKSWMWGLNNLLSKTNLTDDGFSYDLVNHFANSVQTDVNDLIATPEQKLRRYAKSIDQSSIEKWGVNSIDNLELWQFRELMSYALPGQFIDSCDDTIYSNAQLTYPSIKFIEINKFRDNFKDTLLDILNYLKLPLVRADKIEMVHSLWLAKQHHAFKDFELLNIVNCIQNSIEFDWSDKTITLLDEIFLQYLLRERGIEISCYKLDRFPMTTTDFLPLLRLI